MRPLHIVGAQEILPEWIDTDAYLKSVLAYWVCHNYHELGGLKQQKFILLQFWRLEIWSEGVGRVSIPQRCWGDPSCLLQLLAAPAVLWLGAKWPRPFLHLCTASARLYLRSPSSFLMRNLWLDLGSTLNSGWPILEILNLNCKDPFSR